MVACSYRLLGLLVALQLSLAWQDWTAGPNSNYDPHPGPRRGHTLRLADFKNGEKLILFGGQSDDTRKAHDPMSYKIEEINGTLQFVDYMKRPVIEARIVNETVINNTVPVGVYFNDVWQYELEKPDEVGGCSRWADYACNNSQAWKVLDPGAVNGGCRIVMGQEICSTPSERHHHGAAIFNDSTMVVYGGFSHRCAE